MGKSHEEDEAPGAPDWVVTFADMISLLVTFFVMLLTFSSSEELNLLPISGIKLLGRGGALDTTKTPTLVEPLEYDLLSAIDARRGAATPHSRPAGELLLNIEEMGQKETEEHQKVDFGHVADGLVLRFGERSSFAPGSAEISPHLNRSLVELGNTIQHYENLIVIEGFTDSEHKATPTHPTAETLGLARAAAAARILLETSDLPASLVQVAGIGQSRPLAPNNTARNRSLNRRIEIRVISLSKTRSAFLERKRGSK